MKELRKAQGPLEVASGEVMHVELPKMNALWLEAVEGGGGRERERDLCGLGGVPQNAQLSTNYNISGSSPMIT